MYCSSVGDLYIIFFFFFQAEDGIRDKLVTGVQTCALPISLRDPGAPTRGALPRARDLCARPRRAANLEVLRVLDRRLAGDRAVEARAAARPRALPRRSEEHTSELQSLAYLVCRLLLEKKKNKCRLTSATATGTNNTTPSQKIQTRSCTVDLLTRPGLGTAIKSSTSSGGHRT